MTSLAAFLKAETLFLEKVQYNQSYYFASCRYGCDSWNIKNGE